MVYFQNIPTSLGTSLPQHTIFLLAFGKTKLNCLRFRTSWQDDSPPNYKKNCVATVTENLNCGCVLHVLQRNPIGTNNSIIHSVKIRMETYLQLNNYVNLFTIYN